MINKLSIVISVKEEEKSIGKCLRAIEKMSDDIIIIDDLSNDDTVKIAKKFTKRVYSRKSNFETKGLGEQKNFGLSKAENGWILSLDADEIVTTELCSEIKRIIKYGNKDGYFIKRNNIFLSKSVGSDFQLRLFKKTYGKFSNSYVHEKIELSGSIGFLTSVLLHNSTPDLTTYLKKFNIYTALDAKQMLKSNKDKLTGKEIKLNPESSLSIFLFCLVPSIKWFFREAFLNFVSGYGMYGFFYKILGFFNQFIGRMKYWQMISSKE